MFKMVFPLDLSVFIETSIFVFTNRIMNPKIGMAPCRKLGQKDFPFNQESIPFIDPERYMDPTMIIVVNEADSFRKTMRPGRQKAIPKTGQKPNLKTIWNSHPKRSPKAINPRKF